MTSEEVQQLINETKKRLKELYHRRHTLRHQEREKERIGQRPKMSSDSRRIQILELAKTGKTIRQISNELQLGRSTVSNYLWGGIRDEALNNLLKRGEASITGPNEYGGISWHYDRTALQAEAAKIEKGINYGYNRKPKFVY